MEFLVENSSYNETRFASPQYPLISPSSVSHLTQDVVNFFSSLSKLPKCVNTPRFLDAYLYLRGAGKRAISWVTDPFKVCFNEFFPSQVMFCVVLSVCEGHSIYLSSFSICISLSSLCCIQMDQPKHFQVTWSVNNQVTWQSNHYWSARH